MDDGDNQFINSTNIRFEERKVRNDFHIYSNENSCVID